MDRKYNHYDKLRDDEEAGVNVYAAECHGQEFPFERHERDELWQGRKRFVWLPHEDQLKTEYNEVL